MTASDEDVASDAWPEGAKAEGELEGHQRTMPGGMTGQERSDREICLANLWLAFRIP